MKSQIFLKYLSTIKSFIIVFILTIGVSYTLATWTNPPTGTPPNCPAGEPGCDAPLNVGSSGQAKAGRLGINQTSVPTSNYKALEVLGGITSNTLNGEGGIFSYGQSAGLAFQTRDVTPPLTWLWYAAKYSDREPAVRLWNSADSDVLTINRAGIIKARDFCLDVVNGKCLGGSETVELIHGKKMFKENGVFVVPAGVTKVWVSMSGGGGGGGNGSGTKPGGGGGGADAIMAEELTVTPGSSYSIVVGAGGQKGSQIGSRGNAGGDSSFGDLIKTKGGYGGFLPGPEDTGTRALGLAGGPGGSAGHNYSFGAIYFDNRGGGSIFGSGGISETDPYFYSTIYNKANGGGYGGGGAGGSSNNTTGTDPGNGAPGFVLVEW